MGSLCPACSWNSLVPFVPVGVELLAMYDCSRCGPKMRADAIVERVSCIDVRLYEDKAT